MADEPPDGARGQRQPAPLKRGDSAFRCMLVAPVAQLLQFGFQPTEEADAVVHEAKRPRKETWQDWGTLAAPRLRSGRTFSTVSWLKRFLTRTTSNSFCRKRTKTAIEYLPAAHRVLSG